MRVGVCVVSVLFLFFIVVFLPFFSLYVVLVKQRKEIKISWKNNNQKTYVNNTVITTIVKVIIMLTIIILIIIIIIITTTTATRTTTTTTTTIINNNNNNTNNTNTVYLYALVQYKLQVQAYTTHTDKSTKNIIFTKVKQLQFNR